jgi:methyl-accepting chemotaxis protein
MSKMTDAGDDSGDHRGRNVDDEEMGRLTESLTKTVDQWKARIDQLRVQVDLARLDLRASATKHLDVAQNACLAATSRLRDARHDTAANTETLRDGVEKILHDVKEAFDAAKAVVDRG